MPDKLISIQNLSINFNKGKETVQAIKNINFSVNKAETLAIVGESGSGKSVTALSILKLLPSDSILSGNILFYDNKTETDLMQCAADEMQQVRGNKISMIFQEPMSSLNPVQACGYQVKEALITHKKISPQNAFKKTVSLFEQVQLSDAADMYNRYPFELSGGQKQRVMIAMAMCCHPSLLICDEPTTALDVTVQKNILEIIKNLQKESGMSVIFISHDFGVVSEIADRIIVMHKGQIVEEGKTKELLSNPQHYYTKAILACRPALHHKGERLPVVSDFINKKEPQQEKTIETEKTSIGDAHITIVKAEHVKVWYPAQKSFAGKITAYKKAVNNVSFEIYKGETLGLVGESGCGKTTLGRALLGLQPINGGNIFFEGKNLAERTTSEMQALRKNMQIIFQDPFSSLNPRKKIGEAVSEPLKVHHIADNKADRKEKTIQLLKKVGLTPEHYNRYPHEFSGGQRQRIVIARALALEPSFIVCDESVSALDVSVQAQILNLLNDLKKEFSFTALFISHDLSVVRYISDRIMVMHHGIIEETGTTEAIYHHPQKDYTKKLLSSIPGLHITQ